MDHIAILKKSKISNGDNLLADILRGAKTVESRWYVNKINPWNKIKEGHTTYFKESGCPVTVKARVSKVIQYENLNKETIQKIIQDYGERISPNSSKKKMDEWVEKLLNKRYCVLIFLEGVEAVKPFDINKKGYGISCAWMCVGDIKSVKIS